MERAPFERVERMQRMLPDALLPGLITVFSKVFSDDLLLVHLRQLDVPMPPQVTAITVDELPSTDLAEYDGPTMGLASVDLIRPDIPTKGAQFVRLDRVLRHRGQVARLRETWARFAEYLDENFDEILADRPDDAFRHRATVEIAAISAPHKIAGLAPERRRGMIAFVPARNEVVHLEDVERESGFGWGGGPDDKVIALEEARPLIEGSHPGAVDNRYPIELRTVLRRNNLNDELADTLRQLAAVFYERWLRTGDRTDCEYAYSLGLELHLAHGDADDLTAVLPDTDFDAFVNHGAGTYVYRRPLEGSRGRSLNGVHRRYLDDACAELSGPGAPRPPVVFSLQPLRGAFGDEHQDRWFWSDLGPVLRKSGRTEILARNAWLLVQDFLDASRERRGQFRVSLESLLEAMTHCCAIFSLTDPWRTRQGRRNPWLLKCYQTLQRVLGMLVQTSDGPQRWLYTALEDWYGCALHSVPDVQATLERMTAGLSARPRMISHHGRDAEFTALGDELEAIGKALLELLHGGGRAKAYHELTKPVDESIPQVLSRATDMTRSLALLSVPFFDSFRLYAATADTVRTARAAQIPVRDKIERLTAGAEALKRGRRLIFAPFHQERILALLYDRAISETTDRVQRLQGGASLEVELKTRVIAPYQQDSGIVFAVTNTGSVAARAVEVELELSDDFELLDQSYTRTLARLGPEEEHSFRFSVRALSGDDTFPIRCLVSCSDTGDERQQRTLEFVMRVVGLDSGPFEKKPNPYVFGLPLQEHRQFYGRRNELEELLGHLAIRRPQNMLLRGARRTGKTSLLYMVRAVLADAAGQTGARQWFELSETWHEALDATRPVILDLQAIDWPDGVPTPTSFHHAVLAALREEGLTCPGAEVLLTEPTVTSTQFIKALRDIVRLHRGVRPVLLVDEFDILDPMAEKFSFYGPLRSAITTVQGVTWIVASALGMYNEVRDYASPLFNVFKIIPLGRLDAAATKRLVHGPWGPEHSAPLRFADDAVEAIMEEAGRYPYFIQLLCSGIVDHVNRTHTNYVQYRTVLQVIRQHMLLEGSASWEHFAYMWDTAGGVGRLIFLSMLRHPGALSHDELRRSVLQLLDHVPAGRAAAAMAAFDDSLHRLLVLDAVRQVPGGGYTFGIPLFRRLLLERNEREDLEQAAYHALRALDPPAVAHG